MPKASHSEQVAAPVEAIWRVLLAKVESPGRYLSFVNSSRVVEREAGSLLRRLSVGEIEVEERVTAFDKRHEVDAVLTDGPYAGQAKDVIQPPLHPGLSATLTLSLDWRRRDGGADALDVGEALRQAVLKIKAEAEGA